MAELRLIVADDAEKLRQLLRTCWLDTYKGILPDSVIQTAITVWQSKESLLRGLRNPQAFYSGCFEDGKWFWRSKMETRRASRSTASTVSHTKAGLWSRSAERRFLACLVNYICRV